MRCSVPVAIRVVVVDDHPIFRVGLSRALAAATIDVVGEAGTAAEAIAVVRRTRPDVVLLDAALPDRDGFATCREILMHVPTVRVVFLTSYDDASSARAALMAGARAMLSKETAGGEIVRMLERVVLDDLWTGFPQRHGGLLTEREMDVLELLAFSLSQSDIAARLGLGVETVKSYARELYGKLGVSDKASALAEARRLGLLASPPVSGVPSPRGKP